MTAKSCRQHGTHPGHDACPFCRIFAERREKVAPLVAAKRETDWKQVEAAAVSRISGENSKASLSDCAYRGQELRLAPCANGPKCGKVSVKSCTIYGECTNDPEKSTKGVKQCRFCNPPPREFAPGLADPIQTPYGPRERGWPWMPATRDEHVAALAEVVRLTEGIAAPERSGQGVLIVGGGKFWPGVVISCRLLREVGYDGPIHVWHMGKSEPVNLADVVGLNVTVVDAEDYVSRMPPHQRPRKLGGWEAKSFAIMHCGFEKVFYLDADAYVVRDPSPLFSLLNDSPFAYWQEPYDNVWGPYHGLHPATIREVTPVQSGQMLIDVRRFWREIVIARWIDDHADYFCPRTSEPRKYWHQFGDQDSWRVALAYTHQKRTVVGPAKWKDFYFTYKHDNEDIIVHRCGSKLIPGTKPRWDDTLPLEKRVEGLWAELTAPAPVRALITSVNYTDCLKLTLHYNRHHFSEVYVVTTPEDEPNVRPVAEANGVKVIVTDSFYKDGADFNKYGAIEYGLDVMGREGWVCLLDADVVLPRDAKLDNLVPGNLYGPLRRMLDVVPPCFPPEDTWRELPLFNSGNHYAGYCQIFHASDAVIGSPPWHGSGWNNASGGDTFLQNKWALANKIRPPWECLHIGPHGVNWKGRTSTKTEVINAVVS